MGRTEAEMALLTEERMSEIAGHMDVLRKRLENSQSVEKSVQLWKLQVQERHLKIFRAKCVGCAAKSKL